MRQHVWIVLLLLYQVITTVLENAALIATNPTQQTVGSALNINKSYSHCLYKTISEMRLLQLNTRAYSTSKNYLSDFVDKENIDVFFGTETWGTSESISFKDWNSKDLIKNRKPDPNSDRISDSEGGVASFARPSCKIVARKDFDIFDNLEVVWAQIFVLGKIINVANIYIPPDRSDQLQQFVENIDFVKSKSDDPNIVGDLNARSYAWENWHKFHKRRYDTSFKHGDTIQKLCVDQNFRILNDGRHTHDRDQELDYVHDHGDDNDDGNDDTINDDDDHCDD